MLYFALFFKMSEDEKYTAYRIPAGKVQFSVTVSFSHYCTVLTVQVVSAGYVLI